MQNHPPNQPNHDKKKDKTIKTNNPPAPPKTFRSFFFVDPLTPETPSQQKKQARQPRFKPLKRWYVHQVALNATPAKKDSKNTSKKQKKCHPLPSVIKGVNQKTKGTDNARERADTNYEHFTSIVLISSRLVSSVWVVVGQAGKTHSFTSPHKPAGAYRRDRPRNSGSCSSRRTRAARSRRPSS